MLSPIKTLPIEFYVSMAVFIGCVIPIFTLLRLFQRDFLPSRYSSVISFAIAWLLIGYPIFLWCNKNIMKTEKPRITFFSYLLRMFPVLLAILLFDFLFSR